MTTDEQRAVKRLANERYLTKLRADPERYAVYLAKARAKQLTHYRTSAAYRARQKELKRLRYARIKASDPAAYDAYRRYQYAYYRANLDERKSYQRDYYNEVLIPRRTTAAKYGMTTEHDDLIDYLDAIDMSPHHGHGDLPPSVFQPRALYPLDDLVALNHQIAIAEAVVRALRILKARPWMSPVIEHLQFEIDELRDDIELHKIRRLEYVTELGYPRETA